MAAKRHPTRPPIRFTPPDEDDGREIISEFDPAEESFSQFRNKFGSEGVIVKIYRRTPQGMQYCFQGIPSEIDEEMIRVYHAKQTYAAEAGQYYARPFVNGEPRESFQIPIAPQVGATVAMDTHGGMAQGGSLVAMLQAQLDRLEAKINMNAQQEREPLGSLADAMLKLQQLTPRQELPVDTLMKAIELGKSMGPAAEGDDWKSIIGEIVRNGAPLFQGIAASLLSKTQQPGNNNGGGEQVQVVGDRQRLFAAIQYLKAKCIKGSDPDLYVDLIIDGADDADNQKLIHAIVTNEFSVFVEIDAELGKPPFHAFFRRVYDGLRSAVEVSNPVEPDTGGTPGNAGHAANDGKASKGSTKKR